MTPKQKIALIAPVILFLVMYPVFQLFSSVFGEQLGWYLGLIFYWILWGAGFPLRMIGKEEIKKIIRPQKLTGSILLILSVPFIFTLLTKLIPGMEYHKSNIWILLMLLSTAFGNGFFEEMLWRGVYLKLFPENLFFRMIWPSFWFAVWHIAPGSVSSNSNVVALVVGAGLFGLVLSFLAKKSNSIWWCIVCHTVCGIVMVI